MEKAEIRKWIAEKHAKVKREDNRRNNIMAFEF